MDYLSGAVAEALRMILERDPVVVQSVSASLRFALVSTLLASVLGAPAGVVLALARFPLRGAIVSVLDTLLALPTVIAGLFVYALLFRQGPLGGFGLLFTPAAIVIGQTVLILPVVTALTRSAVATSADQIAATARTLGAGRPRVLGTVLAESRVGVLAACVTAFGRVIGEVGVSMMLGGNIAGYTRTLTTVIALETSKGGFAQALAMGLVLLVMAFAVNLCLRGLARAAA